MEDPHPLFVEVGEKAMRVLVTLSISAKYSIFLMRYLKLDTSRLTDYLRWIYLERVLTFFPPDMYVLGKDLKSRRDTCLKATS